MRAIICGGRNIGRASGEIAAAQVQAELERASDERAFVFEALTALHVKHGFAEIIAGDEGGCERLGLNWAGLNNIPVSVFSRERRSFRKETIDERNVRMLVAARPDAMVCFGGGEATERLVAAAQRSGVPVTRISVTAQSRHPIGRGPMRPLEDELARMARQTETRGG